jgi:uncharacterized membrane protein YhhN
MPGWFWFPLAVFFVTLPAFLVAELRAGRLTVLPLKILCSLCFITVALLGIGLGASRTHYGTLMLIGLCFSLLGDLALVWKDQRKPFMLGLAAFLVAQVIYGAAFSLQNGFSAWDLLLFAALAGTPILAYRFIDMEVGRMKIPVLAYVAVIAFMFAKALSSIYLEGIPMPALLCVVVGAGLFYISDVFLALFKFHRRPRKALRVANLTTYYCGQMLLAFSILLISAQ